MKWKPYPSYKDSGLFGVQPSGWPARSTLKRGHQTGL